MCWFTYVANMPNEAGQYAEQMLDLVNDNGFPEFAPWALVYRGWPSAAVGDAGKGVELLTKALSIRRAAGATVASATILAMLAEAYAWLGLPAEGLARLDEAAQFMEATDDRSNEADVYRVRGDLLNMTVIKRALNAATSEP